ncbi:MAG: hypothetical protein KDC67_16160, partial [Ignavibacteriae bacterium]|nr:hypothetical protein [Ignavibacteriota bacterium]
TESEELAIQIAEELENLNLERRELTQTLIEEAKNRISDLDKKIIMVFGEEWSEGVVGLVAGKLQEEFFRPVLVASLSGDNATGSARSIPSFNVTEALHQHENLLERYGGHAQAAGFSIKKENIEEFTNLMEKFAEENILDEDMVKEIIIDSEIEGDDIIVERIHEIDKLGPFGYKNKRPVFKIEDVVVRRKKIIGRDQNHVKLSVQKDTKIFDVLAFNKVEELAEIVEGQQLDLVGSLRINSWNGNNYIQMNLIDFKNA